jgi:hypothetical protein
MYSYALSLTSALDGGVGGQRHAPAALPRERPGFYCTGDCVRPRVGLDRWGKSRPHRDSILGPSRPQGVAIPTPVYRSRPLPPTFSY